MSLSIPHLSSNERNLVTLFFGRARRTRAVLVVMLAISTALLSSCDRRAPAASADSSSTISPVAPTDSMRPVVTATGWDSTAGPFIVLPTVDGGLTSGSLLRADASELTVSDTGGIGRLLADRRVDLFSRSGRVTTALLSIDSPPHVDAGCTAWPVARLTADGAAGVPPAGVAPWTAAFASKKVTAIPLDSIEGLSSRDSTRLAIDLARLASGLRDDSSTTFRGLPFVVLRAYRARGLDTSFVVATLARRVNQEADPKEERLVMVVDVIGDDSKKWTVAWHERASGKEDELVVAEPLLAFRANGASEVRLLFGRDDGVALGAAVLARGKSGWHVLWESAVAGCN